MMGRLSLILPVDDPSALPLDDLARCRQGLERSGYDVEVIAVSGPRASVDGLASLPGGGIRWLHATRPGLAPAALQGLVAAGGNVLVVLDPSRGFLREDLAAAVEPVASGRADLVTGRLVRRGAADRGPSPWRFIRALAGRMARRWIGTVNPLSGLVVVRPSLVREIAGTFEPVGSHFTLDLVLRTRGRKLEVAVGTAPADSGRAPRPVPRLDELRHVKRLADDQFGNASRLVQFCVVGASGMVIDLTCYALLQLVLSRTELAGRPTPFLGVGWDLTVSGALAIATALVWNFSWNRRLTFNDARGGDVFRQFVAYVMSNALGVALSLSLRLLLPAHVAFFQRHKLAAAVVGIVTATGISFSLARWVVFNHRPASPAGPSPTHAEARPVSADG